jgi:periplasmic protein TonB
MEQRRGIEFYTQYHKRRLSERDFFAPLMTVMLLLFGGVGLYLRTHNPPPVTISEQMSKMQQTRFIINEPKPLPKIEKPKPAPKEEKKEEPLPDEPIDLTQKPLLNQDKDIIEEPPPEPVKKKVRRVYGLKKVYSTGIGAAGGAADAIIGKRGNTLNADIDTITATESDLKSPPVSITRVTTPPRTKSMVKPEYTKEMLEARVEGVVRVKVLVDTDGRVKQAVVLDDLGYGSKQKVAEACFKSLFVPAMIGDEPVSTWIMIKIRFTMLPG